MSRAPVPLVFITHAFTGTTVNTTEHISLTFPIEHDGLPNKEIALRRPTVGDHLTAQKAAGTDAERKIRLIANLAELPPAVIHRLDMKDYAQLQKVLGGLFAVNQGELPALVVELALYTHWPRSELLVLEVSELVEALSLARRLSTLWGT